MAFPNRNDAVAAAGTCLVAYKQAVHSGYSSVRLYYHYNCPLCTLAALVEVQFVHHGKVLRTLHTEVSFHMPSAAKCS